MQLTKSIVSLAGLPINWTNILCPKQKVGVYDVEFYTIKRTCILVAASIKHCSAAVHTHTSRHTRVNILSLNLLWVNFVFICVLQEDSSLQFVSLERTRLKLEKAGDRIRELEENLHGKQLVLNELAAENALLKNRGDQVQVSHCKQMMLVCPCFML